MIIPEFLKDNDVIGITACSAGVLDKIKDYEDSLDNFKKYGFKIKETSNVRTSGLVSSDKVTRALELQSLFLDKDVKMVAIARGGDFLYEMLDEVDFKVLSNNVKWLVGSSDPTSLLYILTTKYDIATMYSPCNTTGLNINPLHESYLNYLKFIKGDLVKQERYPYTEEKGFSDNFTKDNRWLNLNGDVYAEGIVIGGCIDVLKDVIGTKFDKTQEFIKRYEDEGFIWYFDIFSMSAESLYITLLQFKNAGWFKNTKAILFSKVCFPSSFVDMSYEDAIKKALPNVKVVYLFDIGHVKPSFTMINGMKARIISNDKEGSLEYLEKSE